MLEWRKRSETTALFLNGGGLATPNNVSIDGYCTADVRIEPVVVNVPPPLGDRWTLVQVGDCSSNDMAQPG